MAGSFASGLTNANVARQIGRLKEVAEADA